MSGKYEKVRELLPLIKEMSGQGKTQQQTAIELGLANKKVVSNLLYREKQKESKAFPNSVAANRQIPCRSINTKTSV